MTRATSTVLIFVVGLVAGAAAGGYAGATLSAGTVVSMWLTTNARDAEEVVGVLEHLRAGRGDEGLAALESHLNRHVFGLMPSAREGVSVSDASAERAAGAKRVVIGYRQRFPHEGGTALDQDVRRFLAAP